jgi:hypothetical protein
MSMAGSTPPRAWEYGIAGVCLLAALHFLALRIRAAALPQGDEGSWLAVAAELSRGHGFTTRWLEYHFLKPYTLPRPDDFRFPGLTGLLALVFQFTGVSWRAAQWTVAWVFLIFCAASWLAVRRAFGVFTGLAVCALTCCSLLQLHWNSQVYTEGLFGVVLSLLVLAALTGDSARPSWWLRLGLCAGALYLVRPNGLLFAGGFLWLAARGCPGSAGKSAPGAARWTRPLLGLAAMAAAMAPWLMRTWIRFGNPLHVAGSAGMLRNTRVEPSTYGLADYLHAYGPLFPLRRVAVGSWEFLRALNHFEHGLEAIPLALALVALFRRRVFFHPFVACGFALSFLAFAYTSYNSWAGVRYAAPLLPFVYAYGLSQLPEWWAAVLRGSAAARTSRRVRSLSVTLGAAAILLLPAPTLFPHRHYERRLVPARAEASLSDHIRRLQAAVPPGGRYYAASLGGINFLSDRDCVGLQELNDSTWFERSQAALHPRWVALARREDGDSALAAALDRMRAGGYTLDTVDRGPEAVYLELRARRP